jgi:hypothetical protein
VPAADELFIESDEYGPSFNSSEQGTIVNLNVLYRLGENYKNIHRLEDAFKNASSHIDIYGEQKDFYDLILDARAIGQVLGIQFRLIFSVKNFEVEYSYPEPSSDGSIYTLVE